MNITTLAHFNIDLTMLDDAQLATGKTVRSMLADKYDNEITILFTDNTFLQLKYEADYDDTTELWPVTHPSPSVDLLAFHGLISSQQRDEYHRDERTYRNEQSKKFRLQQYEDLRKEFEGDDNE